MQMKEQLLQAFEMSMVPDEAKIQQASHAVEQAKRIPGFTQALLQILGDQNVSFG